MNDYKIDFRNHLNTGKIVGPHVNKMNRPNERATGVESFGAILERTMENGNTVKFSRHAKERISARDIHLSDGDMDKIYRAFEIARQKGIRDSLVIMDDLALIINIPSKTVITALDGSRAKENVFTNIDGAVIV